MRDRIRTARERIHAARDEMRAVEDRIDHTRELIERHPAHELAKFVCAAMPFVGLAFLFSGLGHLALLTWCVFLPVAGIVAGATKSWRIAGAPAIAPSPNAPRALVDPPSLGIAYLLATPPFGLLGFHRFYLGRFSTGLLFLPTLGIFGIGWLHDLITMPELVRRAGPPAATLPREEGDAIATAYLLWLFLGWLGVHRFYAGRVASGVFYFFTLGGFLIGWLLDAVAIPAIVREARRRQGI